jgi:hypothetical protein
MLVKFTPQRVAYIGSAFWQQKYFLLLWKTLYPTYLLQRRRCRCKLVVGWALILLLPPKNCQKFKDENLSEEFSAEMKLRKSIPGTPSVRWMRLEELRSLRRLATTGWRLERMDTMATDRKLQEDRLPSSVVVTSRVTREQFLNEF